VGSERFVLELENSKGARVDHSTTFRCLDAFGVLPGLIAKYVGRESERTPAGEESDGSDARECHWAEFQLLEQIL